MVDVTEMVPTLIIVVVVLLALVVLFIFPFFYDLFLVRGVCMWIGKKLVVEALGGSIFTGITEAGLFTFCNIIPF